MKLPLLISLLLTVAVTALTEEPRVPFKFTIALKQHNLDVLRTKVLEEISNPESEHYGEYMSPEEVNQMIGYSDEEVRPILEYLNRTLDSHRCVSYGDSIQCEIYPVEIPLPKSEGRKLHILDFINGKLISDYWVYQALDIKFPEEFSDMIEFVEYQRPLHQTENIRRRLRRKVLGNRAIGRSHYNHSSKDPRFSTSNAPDPGMVTREVLMRLYNYSDSMIETTTEVSVGLMEYMGQSGFSQSDLTYIQQLNDLPARRVPSDQIIGTNNGPDTESELDIQLAAQAAGDISLWYEDFNGWMYSWAVDFFNRQKVPQVISLSWDWNEQDQCNIIPGGCPNNMTDYQYVKRCNTEFMKIAARGTTMVVASGDAGSPGRTGENCTNGMNPVFPGSSEWVLSVGATYIVNNSRSSSSSDVTVENNNDFGAGLGSNSDYICDENMCYRPRPRQRSGPSNVQWNTPVCSHLLNCSTGNLQDETYYTMTGWTSGAGWALWTWRPPYQNLAIYSYRGKRVHWPTDNFWNRYGRAYPDVSAIGHNCAVYQRSGFGWMAVDGTSCAAPVMAGLIAVLNQHQLSVGRPTLGFVNPLLYTAARYSPETFTDVTAGNSSCTEMTCCSDEYGFQPAEGYDVVSGLGVPNVGNLLDYLGRF